MDTPVLNAIKILFDQFHKYAVNGIVQGKQADAYIHDNFAAVIKNPTHPEEVKKLLKDVDDKKVNGIIIGQYAGLLCALLQAYSRGEIGIASEPKAE